MVEYLDVVNDKDEAIGRANQEEVYEKKLNHRIVHVFVINPETKDVFIQKRAETKSFLPGYYCTSAGGHVKSGESYEEAAKRELKEELGLEPPLIKIGSVEFISGGHKRFIEIFVAYADGEINFGDEVSSGAFMGIEDVRNLIRQGSKIHPQLPQCFEVLFKIYPNLTNR